MNECQNITSMYWGQVLPSLDFPSWPFGNSVHPWWCPSSTWLSKPVLSTLPSRAWLPTSWLCWANGFPAVPSSSRRPIYSRLLWATLRTARRKKILSSPTVVVSYDVHNSNLIASCSLGGPPNQPLCRTLPLGSCYRFYSRANIESHGCSQNTFLPKIYLNPTDLYPTGKPI